MDKRKGRENRGTLIFSKKSLYYWNASMFKYAKTLGGESYLYYS